MDKHTLRVDDRELATILVGLRALQDSIADYTDRNALEYIESQWPEYFAETTALGDAEIDELVERLNIDPIAEPASWNENDPIPADHNNGDCNPPCAMCRALSAEDPDPGLSLNDRAKAALDWMS